MILYWLIDLRRRSALLNLVLITEKLMKTKNPKATCCLGDKYGPTNQNYGKSLFQQFPKCDWSMFSEAKIKKLHVEFSVANAANLIQSRNVYGAFYTLLPITINQCFAICVNSLCHSFDMFFIIPENQVFIQCKWKPPFLSSFFQM